MQVVTPDKPEATDSVAYKELGKIILLIPLVIQLRMQSQFIMLIDLRMLRKLLNTSTTSCWLPS
ncbi:MAG: hypothetical protein ACLS36_05490 [Streptococcus sp.]